MNGKGARVRQQADQVGRSLREPQHEGFIVRRLGPEHGDREVAGDDGRRVLNTRQHLCIERRGLRVDEPPHAGHEVIGGNRLAVRPAQLVAKMKCINKAIVRHIPGLGRGRSQLAGRRKSDKALAEIAQDIGGLGAARLVRVEGFRV